MCCSEKCRFECVFVGVRMCMSVCVCVSVSPLMSACMCVCVRLCMVHFNLTVQ